MAYQPKSYKKFVATAATATLVASALVPVASADYASTASFTDVTDRYKDAVDYLVSKNLSKGLSETEYGVQQTIKRGDAAIILANALGLNDDKNAAESGFSDVPTRASLAINSLKAAGVINGKTATSFGFNDNLTRGEVALIMANAKAYALKGDVSKLKFTDVSSRYLEAVAGLVEAGITSGKTATKFGTGDAITRGEFAIFVYKAETSVKSPIDSGAYELKVTAAKTTLAANGADNTVITVNVIDKVSKNIAVDADDIVLAFDATFGSLANSRVTVQDGVATVLLTSEFSKQDLKSIVTAKLIETASESKWYDEIGIVGSVVVDFKPVSGQVDVNNMPVITSAESNEADRLTVFFDKAVNPAMFLSTTNPLTVSVNQGTGNKAIAGYLAVAGNPNAIEVVLAKTDVLTDNKQVNVNQVIAGIPTVKSFILTDARQPEATSVKQIAYNKLEVTFSEPVDTIATNQVLIDGGVVEIASVSNGEFVQSTGDKRHTLVVTTTKFISAGKHSIQLSGVKDFAGRTDNANISTNQIFDFVVAGSDIVPAAVVTVESPEQLRLKFNTYVEGFDASAEAVVQWYNPATKVWEVPTVGTTFSSTPTWTVSTVDDGSEYVYELNQDWTQYFNTSGSNDNYYNHQFRVVLAKDAVTNPANGKKNALQELSLNYAGSALNNPDNVSPAISGTPTLITTGVNKDKYLVTFNEPVKLNGKDNANTPSQLQQAVTGSNVPNVVVEFIGTDKDGKKSTVQGKVVDYAGSSDNAFIVDTNTANALQTEVDANGFGETWQLVVRNVTDDIGNAANTLTAEFKVAKTTTPASVFQVKSANGTTYDGVKFLLSTDAKDVVELKFSSGVSFTGNTENALNLSNYTLNGLALPSGSVAKLSDGDANVNNGYELVTIEVPNGTLKTTPNTNVINISKALKSASGLTITGLTEVSELAE